MINGPGEAVLAAPIKRWEPYVEYSVYPTDNGPAAVISFEDKWALAVSITAERENPTDPFTWILKATYTSKFWDAINRDLKKNGQDPNSQNKDSPQNPLTRPPHYDYGQWTWQRALDHDFRNLQTGNGILGSQSMTNTAGDKFDPPYMFEEAGLSIIVTRNEPFFDTKKANAYSRRMNSAPMWGHLQYCILCRSITGSDEIENGFAYSKVRYEFWIKDLTLPRDGSFTVQDQSDPTLPIFIDWRFLALSQGYNQIDPNNAAKRIAILCPTHGVVMQPQPLDSSGHVVQPGSPKYYQSFWVFPAADLNDLAIPSPPGA